MFGSECVVRILAMLPEYNTMYKWRLESVKLVTIMSHRELVVTRDVSSFIPPIGEIPRACPAPSNGQKQT